MHNYYRIVWILVFFPIMTYSQGLINGGKVTGNVQVDAQVYQEDDKLGITDSTLNYKEFGMNGFANILYSNGNFNAGARFEGFLNPMVGFDPRYEGVGVPYWFANYKTGSLEFTAGHFYEQFGSGLILRSWEEWTLGYDNNIYGFNAKFSPVQGVTIKGLVGVQRYFWEPYEPDSRGIVRGFDGDFYLNDIFNGLEDSKTRITLGGSFVSRYEKSNSMTFNRKYPFDSIMPYGDTVTWTKVNTYEYQLPVNVGSWAGRFNLAHGGFNFYAEYAEKDNDPNATNNFIYKKGQALYSTFSYSTKGFGLFLATKWIDNMYYKSSRNESGNPPMLDINYLPAISKEHQYSLATMYPYATKQNGEFGFQGQIIYTFPKKSTLGGKYGTTLTANYSFANSIKKEQISPEIPIDSTGTDGYQTNFFSIGDLPFYRDLNFLIEKKINSKIKLKAAYYNQTYNLNVIEEELFDDDVMVYANIGVIDFTYKFDRRNSLRTELQGLWTKEDEGDWAALTLEYNVSPTWFFSVMDEYNYGHPDTDRQIHYYNVSFGYTDNTNRISVRYGRQREGLLCVGGVCRYVPASTGLTLTITSSF
ncbi:MAG: hypothetical protein KQI35_11645 [Bacteroidetes bacterium]|nr:hypothetical protein [Bacteroidota bacterium]